MYFGVIPVQVVHDEPAITAMRAKIPGTSLLRGGSSPDRALLLTNCTELWQCAFRNWGAMRGTRKLIAHQYDTTWSRVVLACGWAFLIWGMYFYLWSFVLYAVQVVLVMRRLPPARPGRRKPLASRADVDG